MELTVVEQNGWKKLTRFDKSVIRIGSSPANDVQLTSPEIASIHVQIIQRPESPGNCRVLNFGPAFTLLSAGKTSSCETGAQVDVRDCDEVVLGGYHILFTLPLASKTLQSSRQIAASLSMPDAVIRPDYPTTGFLKLKNLGSHPNCPFQVNLEGLPQECFRIDPLPLLYPGGEEDVRIQFFHRGVTPPAGYHFIIVTVTAPTAYPGEQAVLRQELYVDPLLAAGISITDDMPVARVDLVAPPPASISDNPALEPSSTISSDPVAPPARLFDEATPPAPVQMEKAAPKVVRNPSETYWDETS